MTIDLLWAGFLTIGAAAIMALAVCLARRSAWVVLVPLGLLVVATPKTGELALGSIAGVQVRLIDAIAVIAGGAALTRFRFIRQRVTGISVPLLLFIVLAVLSLAAGALVYGTAAWLSASTALVSLAVGAYALSLVDWLSTLRTVEQWLILASAGVCVVAVWNAVSDGLGSASELVTINGELLTSRVIVSWQALFVSAAAMVLLNRAVEQARWRPAALALPFLAIVIVAQHRSVWAATLVGAISLLPRLGLTRTARVALVSAWSLLLLAPLALVVQGSGLWGSVLSSLDSVSASSGTGGVRFEGAQVIVGQQLSQGPWTVLFGSPYGSPWDRVVQGRLISFQPHNFYVEVMARAGLVALACLIVLLWSMFRRQQKARTSLAPVVALTAAYCLAYGFPIVLAPAIGLAASKPESPPDETATDAAKQPSMATQGEASS